MSKKRSSFKLLDQFSKRQTLYFDILKYQPIVVRNISIQRLVVPCRRDNEIPPKRCLFDLRPNTKNKLFSIRPSLQSRELGAMLEPLGRLIGTMLGPLWGHLGRHSGIPVYYTLKKKGILRNHPKRFPG